MPAMQSIDDVDLVLVGFERTNRFGQRYVCQRGVVIQAFGHTGGWIEALILQEEDDASGRALLSGGRLENVGSKRGTKCSTDASRHTIAAGTRLRVDVPPGSGWSGGDYSTGRRAPAGPHHHAILYFQCIPGALLAGSGCLAGQGIPAHLDGQVVATRCCHARNNHAN